MLNIILTGILIYIPVCLWLPLLDDLFSLVSHFLPVSEWCLPLKSPWPRLALQFSAEEHAKCEASTHGCAGCSLARGGLVQGVKGTQFSCAGSDTHMQPNEPHTQTDALSFFQASLDTLLGSMFSWQGLTMQGRKRGRIRALPIHELLYPVSQILPLLLQPLLWMRCLTSIFLFSFSPRVPWSLSSYPSLYSMRSNLAIISWWCQLLLGAPLWLSTHRTKSPLLKMPHGIFWMPDPDLLSPFSCSSRPSPLLPCLCSCGNLRCVSHVHEADYSLPWLHSFLF